MITFKEFLSSQEERLRAEQAARDQAIERWATSVLALIERIAAWIAESDPHGLVEVEHNFDPSPSRTHGDGRLHIRLGDRQVSIRPVGINVLGPRWKPGEGTWAGRVDILGDPYDHEAYLFRHDDGREEWYLRSTRDYQARLLDRASFDAALVEMLS